LTPRNIGICVSRLARSLFSITGSGRGSIFTGSRLARTSASALRTSWRSSRITRVCCHSVTSSFLRASNGASDITPRPIFSITVNQDSPVAG
jgi:hypothetical protein